MLVVAGCGSTSDETIVSNQDIKIVEVDPSGSSVQPTKEPTNTPDPTSTSTPTPTPTSNPSKTHIPVQPTKEPTGTPKPTFTPTRMPTATALPDEELDIPNDSISEIKSLPDELTETFEFQIAQEITGKKIGRRVRIEIPSDFDPGKTYPILFLFHGMGGRIEGLSNYNQKRGTSAESICRGNCIGVIPQGHLSPWNLPSWNLAVQGVNDGLESNADDVAFVEAIIKELSKYPQINTSKVFGIGYSNGAGMVQILAAESDLFQGVAAFATNLIHGREPKNKEHKVMVLQFHGMRDLVIPYNGGLSIQGHVFVDAEKSARIWAEHNECDLKPSVNISLEGDKTIEYSNCGEGKKVFHIGVKNGRHDVARPNKEYLDITWSLFETLL